MLKVLKLVSVPVMATGMLALLTATAFANHAEITATLNCTSATRACFDLTVSTAEFTPNTRHFTVTLLGHKKGDSTSTFSPIGASKDLPLVNNLDGERVPLCFDVTDVTGFDKFQLKIDAVETNPAQPDLTVNGHTSATLGGEGGFTNNCPTPAPSPSPSPSANTTSSLTPAAGTGGFDFRFPLVGLVLIVAGGALYVVSASRGRSAGSR